MDYNELYALTMDVIQKYGQVQFNLGQLNMFNTTGSESEEWLAKMRRTARANSEAAIATLDETVRTMCGIGESSDLDKKVADSLAAAWKTVDTSHD